MLVCRVIIARKAVKCAMCTSAAPYRFMLSYFLVYNGLYQADTVLYLLGGRHKTPFNNVEAAKSLFKISNSLITVKGAHIDYIAYIAILDAILYVVGK